MNDQTNTPQDMWPDEEPIVPQGTPTNQPPIPPVVPPMSQPVVPIAPPVFQPQKDPLRAEASSVPMPKPKLPRKRASWVSWVVTIVILGIVALGGGYAFGKYWPTIQSWFNKGDATNQTGPVAWQPIQPIQGLGMMKAVDPNGNPIEEGAPGYTSSENPNSLSRYYKVGKFIEGQYKGSELIIADLTYDAGGMGGNSGVFRVIKKPDNSLVVIGRQSPDISSASELALDTSKFTIDGAYFIPDLEMPDKITNSAGDSNQIIYRAGVLGFRGSDYQIIKNSLYAYADKWIEVFKNPVNNLPVWTNPKPSQIYTNAPDGPGRDDSYLQGFYVELADGTFLTYALHPSLLRQNYGQPWSGDGVAAVFWRVPASPSVENYDEYSMAHVGGCGNSNYAAVMPDSLMSKLQATGSVGDESSGDMAYEFRDTNEQTLKDLYVAYQDVNQYIGGTVITYPQFLAKHPIFFWKDPFGRIIKFTRKDILPAAECGKPVIYLYPEKTTRVSVKVSPVGGFSFTDPDYGTGWDVIANPDGRLTEVKSNKVYPYLFWEGRGGLYQSPTKGWVIKQAEVSSFLDDKLAQLGLNAKETSDFKEFWLPKMQGAPYYFVGFWGNPVMNQIAPLNITPKPDTIIRILMDFKPLQQPISVKAPTIKTPERKGFTVIEWGGVIQ